MSKSIVNYKLRRDAHLLWRLCENQRDAAELCGATLPTFNRLLQGLATNITRDDIRRGARMFAKECRGKVDKYEWGAIQLMVRLIDPKADVAYRSTASVDSFPRQVEEWLRNNWSQSLGACLQYYVKRELRAKAVRQVIRRAIKKDPLLALRVIDSTDEMVEDVVNRHQRIVTEAEWLVAHDQNTHKHIDDAVAEAEQMAKHARVGVKARKRWADELKDPQEGRRTGEIERNIKSAELLSQVKGPIMVTDRVTGKPRPVDAPPAVEKKPRAKTPKPKPTKKKDTLGGSVEVTLAPKGSVAKEQMSLMEKTIAKREAGEGPTPEQQARIDKLLGL